MGSPLNPEIRIARAILTQSDIAFIERMQDSHCPPNDGDEYDFGEQFLSENLLRSGNRITILSGYRSVYFYPSESTAVGSSWLEEPVYVEIYPDADHHYRLWTPRGINVGDAWGLLAAENVVRDRVHAYVTPERQAVSFGREIEVSISLGEPRGPGPQVYFLRAEGTELVKIGQALHPRKRRRKLQTGCPHRLVEVARVTDGQLTEREIHRILADHRLDDRGEWFRYGDEVRAFIKRQGIGPGAW